MQLILHKRWVTMGTGVEMNTAIPHRNFDMGQFSFTSLRFLSVLCGTKSG